MVRPPTRPGGGGGGGGGGGLPPKGPHVPEFLGFVSHESCTIGDASLA